ncbi:hypothetical protein D4R52_03450 [bacterium]|nr:MAG: hypothetical protein D4R52_03450 [bacterium]
MKICKDVFSKIASAENLFDSWQAFAKGKTKRSDVMAFEFSLERNIFDLRVELQTKRYRHAPYSSFFIQDPKQRNIHKARVRDRLIHHAIFAVLNPIFEETFIPNSFSCQKGKGTHKGVEALKNILRKASKNNTKPCFALKCDIRQFFHSVDHKILISIIGERIKDTDAMWLIREVVDSFPNGVPIGNLTSQLFANIYLNELDKFVKHKLKVPFYVRYTDDFVLVSDSPEKLLSWLEWIKLFLWERLKLTLHPHKLTLRKYHQGIDFLGYIQFPKFRILRNKTKQRILRKSAKGINEQSLQSYLGVLSHCNAHDLGESLKNEFWLQSEMPKK